MSKRCWALSRRVMNSRIVLLSLILLPLVVVLLYVGVGGSKIIEGNVNLVIRKPPYLFSDSTKVLIQKLFIADLHNDILMFSRDILKRSEVGHTDIPRLLESNVSLQTFSAATMLPSSWLNDPYSKSDGGFDLLTPLSISQGYPIHAWFDPLQRALYMSEKLHDAEKRSKGALTIIKTKSGLERFMNGNSESRMAGVLSIEGLHVIDGMIDNLDTLYKSGYRMMGVAHFHDNKVGGSCSGDEQYGLTDFGKKLIRQMEEKGILIDLAHASHEAYTDVLEMATTPVVVSHTGVQGINPIPRNMTDAEIIGVARSGGVIGVGFWDGAIKESSAAGIVKTMTYIKELVGVDYLALGSDFDGSIRAPFTALGLPLIVEELIENGYTEGEIGKIMGGNILRVYRSVLK
ncbi:MAG: dipeptidase, partial [Fibrobacterales bacterium]